MVEKNSRIFIFWNNDVIDSFFSEMLGIVRAILVQVCDVDMANEINTASLFAEKITS